MKNWAVIAVRLWTGPSYHRQLYRSPRLASPLYKRSSTRADARVEPGSLTREAMVASAIPQAANKAVRLCACLQLVAFSFPMRPRLVVLWKPRWSIPNLNLKNATINGWTTTNGGERQRKASRTIFENSENSSSSSPRKASRLYRDHHRQIFLPGRHSSSFPFSTTQSIDLAAHQAMQTANAGEKSSPRHRRGER